MATPTFTRPAPDPRALRNDVVLAAVILVSAVLSAGLSAVAGIYGDEQGSLSLGILYAFVIAAPLAVRRRWPASVAVIVSLAYFVAVTLRIPEVFVGNIAVFIALYTVGAWSADRRRAAVVRIAIIVGMFAWLTVAMYREAIEQADELDVAAGLMSPFVAQMLINLLINVLYFGGAYYFGDRTHAAALARLALEQRTTELEREREVTAAQAVALDRVRIARELHDVVAHHVSAMGVQAGAARAVLERDPDAARAALVGVEESARSALAELRHLLETLRTPQAETPDASTLRLSDLTELVAHANENGLPTSLTVVGDVVPLPEVTQVNLYRIAQEALTNARRHGGVGATADVRVRYGEDDIELEITNTGRVTSVPSPGLGLVGMRERAGASGGTIEIRPRPRGGFLVRVRVPARVQVAS